LFDRGAAIHFHSNGDDGGGGGGGSIVSPKSGILLPTARAFTRDVQLATATPMKQRVTWKN